jgi:hypothetical protein
MPSASRVAGMYAWNQLGRRVKKGSKGIRILAPVVGIRRKKDSEAEKSTPYQNEPVLVGFRSAYVFDVSMTDGSPLPEFEDRATGDVGVYRERLIDFILAQGSSLSTTSLVGMSTLMPVLLVTFTQRQATSLVVNSGILWMSSGKYDAGNLPTRPSVKARPVTVNRFILEKGNTPLTSPARAGSETVSPPTSPLH